VAKACPWCGRMSLPSASRCDCGHVVVSEALLQWVRDSQSAGWSQEQIVQELLRGGYALEDVQAALGEAAGPMARSRQSSTGGGVAAAVVAAVVGIIVLLIVVVLILILAWYLIYGRQPGPPATATPIQQPIEELDRPWEEESGEEQIEERGSSISPSGSLASDGPTKERAEPALDPSRVLGCVAVRRGALGGH